MHCPKCSSDDLKVLDTRLGKLHRLEEEENVKTVDTDSLPLRIRRFAVINGMVEERALTGPSWQWD